MKVIEKYRFDMFVMYFSAYLKKKKKSIAPNQKYYNLKLYYLCFLNSSPKQIPAFAPK